MSSTPTIRTSRSPILVSYARGSALLLVQVSAVLIGVSPSLVASGRSTRRDKRTPCHGQGSRISGEQRVLSGDVEQLGLGLGHDLGAGREERGRVVAHRVVP